MKKMSVIMLVSGICLLAAVAAAEQTGQGSPGQGIAAYNPSAVYTGAYVNELIYYRNPGAAGWTRVTRPDSLQHVSCWDAQRHLRREGTWQGHLNPDGSCGPTSEPSDWAIGNWLNYQESLPGTDQQ
jgi:hypothetical protein